MNDPVARLRRIKTFAKRQTSNQRENARACLGAAIALYIEEEGFTRTVERLRDLADAIEEDAVFPTHGDASPLGGVLQ